MAIGTVLSLAGDELSAPLGKAISEGLITPEATGDVRRANGVFVWSRRPSPSTAWSKRRSSLGPGCREGDAGSCGTGADLSADGAHGHRL